MAGDSCPLCEGPMYSIMTRRLGDIAICATCGDKVLPILNQVNNTIVEDIKSELVNHDATLSSVLRSMLDDQLNIYVMDDDVRRRLEASL